jgi:hypothetical protein
MYNSALVGIRVPYPVHASELHYIHLEVEHASGVDLSC